MAAEGRSHLAAASAGTALSGGARLPQGRNRVKVDPGSLLGSWSGAERGRTIELSAGSAVFVDFALRRSEPTFPGFGQTGRATA